MAVPSGPSSIEQMQQALTDPLAQRDESPELIPKPGHPCSHFKRPDGGGLLCGQFPGSPVGVVSSCHEDGSSVADTSTGTTTRTRATTLSTTG
jgi:hypothetical protein